ncbi:MAG: ABC transporter permease [Proteobacteria bacterium]|nr:ABC transporter permease [Pseudomonadota bacterium]
MHFFLANILKEIKRRFNDPGVMISWIAIPFVIGLLMTSVMGGDGGPRFRAVLFLTDHDETFISQTIASAFSRGQLAEMVEVREIGEMEGKARMEDGEGSAHLVIPEGFGEAWLDREPVTLELTTNPAQSISPRLIRDVLESFLDLGDYLHLVFGEEIKIITEGVADEALESATTAAISTAISDKMTKIGPLIFPPVIEVSDNTPKPEGGAVSYALLLFPGILLMAAFFASNDFAASYWGEKEGGTLQRWRATPARFWQFWAARLLAAMILIPLVTAPIMAAGFFYLGISFEKFATSLVWLALAGPILFSLFSLVQVLSPTRKAGGIFSTLLMFPLLMVGGSFFPTETLPGWLAMVAEYTPNGRVLEPLKGYFLGEFGASGLFADLWEILAVTLMVLVLVAHLSERKLVK